jgi:hypothetical protein
MDELKLYAVAKELGLAKATGHLLAAKDAMEWLDVADEHPDVRRSIEERAQRPASAEMAVVTDAEIE